MSPIQGTGQFPIIKICNSLSQYQLDGVDPLGAYPPLANFNTDTETHPTNHVSPNNLYCLDNKR